jgi:hypothetical protein
VDDVRPELSDTTAKRVARNDATFRDANEKIRAGAERYAVDPAPFLCECADATCRDIVLLTAEEYERIRATPTHFLNVPGHDKHARGWARVVEDRGHYVVVEKLGRAGELAAELDPRN